MKTRENHKSERPEAPTRNSILIGLCVGLIWSVSVGAEANTNSPVLSGRIIDSAGDPVVGASVFLVSKFLVSKADLQIGAACDSQGEFKLILPATLSNVGEGTKSLSLEISSIGFLMQEIQLSKANLTEPILITLSRETIRIGAVSVVARSLEPQKTTVSGGQLIQRANSGLSPSNPLEAVRGAGVSRSGSGFSSQIRFAGSNPNYTLNGAELGTDPAHYGMFSIVPASLLSSVSYNDQVISSAQGSASTIEFSTKRNFSATTGGSVTVSVLEALTDYRKGTDRYFVSGAFRKSVIDELLKQANDPESLRRIPPTAFRDYFLNVGLKLSTSVSLFLDQYLATDELRYNTESTAGNSAGIDAFQRSRQQHLNLDLRGVTQSLSWKASYQRKESFAEFTADAKDSDSFASLYLDLYEHSLSDRASVSATAFAGNWRFSGGAHINRHSAPTLLLRQQNWNFLPPFATSDNPNLYQLGLNALYGDLSFSERGREVALYAETEVEFANWKLSGGLRAQMYNYLAHNYDILGRFSLTRSLSRYSQLQLTGGNFAESPRGKIIDPYQILIRSQIYLLNSVKTKQISLTYNRNYRHETETSARLFAKHITDIPTLTPQLTTFNFYGYSSPILTNLQMYSNREQIYGGISLTHSRSEFLSSILGDRFDLNASYTLTLAKEQTAGFATQISEVAPHSFELEMNYKPRGHWSFGSRLSGRSGYNYSPTITTEITADELLAIYSGSLHLEYLANENSVRFPVYVSLNLSARYETESFAVFANIGNALNRANPIVSAHDGFIYDSGILPSLGATFKF